MTDKTNYWTSKRFTRRTAIRSVAGVTLGLVGANLIGCSGSNNAANQKPAAAGTSAGAASATGVSSTPHPAGQAISTPAAAASAVNRGGVLKFIYDSASQQFLSPRASARGNDSNFLLVNGDNCIYLKADGTLDPAWSLLEKWEQADPTTFVGHLRSGIKFHDGTSFDSQAIKGQMELLNDPKRAPNFLYRSNIQPIKETQVVDATTVRFLLNSPSAGFTVSVLGFTPGIPFSLAQVTKLGDGEILNPSMTGPYKVDSWGAGGTTWSYATNSDYWRKADGPPYLDKIQFQGVDQDETRAASLETGEVDAVIFNASNETTARLVKNKALQARVFEAGPALLLLNHAKAPLDDLKVRQAVAYAIDKQKCLAVLYQGQGSVAKSELPRGTFGYYEYDPYPFDQAKAKALVAASGLPTPIKLSYALTGTPPAASAVLTASLFKDMLDSVGFDVTIQNVADIQDFYLRDATHLSTSSSGARPDPVEQYATYDTSTANFNAGKKSKDPVQAQVDDLVAKARVQFDTSARLQLLQDLAKLCRDNVIGNITTVARTRGAFASQRVGGFDHPEFINIPGGDAFRASLLWLKKA